MGTLAKSEDPSAYINKHRLYAFATPHAGPSGVRDSSGNKVRGTDGQAVSWIVSRKAIHSVRGVGWTLAEAIADLLARENKSVRTVEEAYGTGQLSLDDYASRTTKKSVRVVRKPKQKGNARVR